MTPYHRGLKRRGCARPKPVQPVAVPGVDKRQGI